MAGLLYKDFVSVKGKKVVIIFGILTVLFLILRMVFPGNALDIEQGFMIENASGELTYMTEGEARDSLMVLIPLILIAACITLPTKWTMDICKNDEMTKTMQFVKSLPLEKNTYIASKYIFIGIAVYVLYSMECVWVIIYNGMAGDNSGMQLMMAVAQFLNVFAGMSIVLAAIELPFFITVGVKKGELIKITLLEILSLLVIAYMFFGNLNVLENFDIMNFVIWCQENMVVIDLISIVTTPLVLLLYYISYRVTVRLN